MTDTMKKLFFIATHYGKHYEINHNTLMNTYTLKLWLSKWTFITLTTTQDINPGEVIVRYFEQPRNYFSPSPRVAKLDKLCGKKHRVKNKKYSIISIDEALKLVQNLEQFASTDIKLIPYPCSPEEVI